MTNRERCGILIMDLRDWRELKMKFSKENVLELLDFMGKHIPDWANKKTYLNTIGHIRFVITCVWEE